MFIAGIWEETDKKSADLWQQEVVDLATKIDFKP